jgi:hypothetical protein
MRRELPLYAVVLAAGIAIGAASCGTRGADARERGPEAEMAAREAQLRQKLAEAPVPDTGLGEPLAVWVLPGELAEISGLTVTPEGMLLAHNDEVGRVATLDPRKGSLLQRFSLGDGVRADFEGITMVGDTIYMTTSNGVLHRFLAGGDQARVRFELLDTSLGRECEFEGVAYDPAAGALVLSCKNVRADALEDQLVFYRVSLSDPSAPPAVFSVPLADAIGANDWKQLHPSDVAIDPATGHYIVIASQERALLEITPTGRVVRSASLPRRHRQPEGLAITRDGLLVISDEARQGAASITLYRWRSAAASE